MPFSGSPVTLLDSVKGLTIVTFPSEPSFNDAFALTLKTSKVGSQKTPAAIGLDAPEDAESAWKNQKKTGWNAALKLAFCSLQLDTFVTPYC